MATGPGGRPTLLTEHVIAEVQRLLPAALYIETIALFVGVDKRSFRRWLFRGAREERRLQRDKKAVPNPREEIYVRLRQAVRHGMARGELTDLITIQKASADNWTAAAWRLERRFPERWGRDREILKELRKEIELLREQLGVSTHAIPAPSTPPALPAQGASESPRPDPG